GGGPARVGGGRERGALLAVQQRGTGEQAGERLVALQADRPGAAPELGGEQPGVGLLALRLGRGDDGDAERGAVRGLADVHAHVAVGRGERGELRGALAEHAGDDRVGQGVRCGGGAGGRGKVRGRLPVDEDLDVVRAAVRGGGGFGRGGDGAGREGQGGGDGAKWCKSGAVRQGDGGTRQRFSWGVERAGDDTAPQRVVRAT